MTTKFVYRFKLEPTPEQEHGLARLAGARRFIWNWGLARRRAYFTEHGKTLRYPALNLELTTLKRDQVTKWLAEMDSQALQESLRDLDRSFVNFFEKRARFAKFKKKRKQCDAFRIPQRVKIEGKRVYCPKIGWIRLRLSQPVTVPTKSATFKRDACGDWFVTLIAEREVEDQIALPINAVGVDLGLKTFATFSGDAPDIAIPTFFRKAEHALRKVQRVFSRRKKGSTRRAKAQIRVSRVHRKTARQRSDFLHKTTTALEARHDLICIEDLSVKGLAKTKLGKSILDAAFGEFRRQVEYKSAWSGKLVSVIGRFYPSSKLHRTCGTIKADLTLSDRAWTCEWCGVIIDRDKNAAENILAEGLNLVAAGQADTQNARGASVRLAKRERQVSK
jgi:putative transposase